ncbi:MAG: choice-of-anchor Q domain-containing protein [Chitinophagaceae bacterium]
MRKPLRTAVAFVTFLFIIYACRKNDFTSDADAFLRTSVDTLHFDTVFTSAGSVTHVFKIFNPNDKGIRISSIRLMGNAASPFKINVNGLPGPIVSGTELRNNDSLYVFATVTIDPNADNLPFVIRDSIEIIYNGNRRIVQLEAYGQNAHFLRGRIIKTNETWNNDLPYVILGGILVDTNAVLTINKGTRIHMHADAPFYINGTLHVNGEKEENERVIFTGDRLDDPYKNFPASYPGLFFLDVSKNNILNYTVIKNAYQAVVVNEPASNASPKLTLNETIIENAYDAGILAINSSIVAKNVLISNCGQNLFIVKGGDYKFTHCTIAAYSTSYLQHKKPIVYITNALDNQTRALNAIFENCIIWGESGGLVKEEVQVVKVGTNPFSVIFDYILWSVDSKPALATVPNFNSNANPQFDSINTASRYFDFRLNTKSSPAIDKGAYKGVLIDLDGNPRPINLPDLGAFEKQ